MSTSRETVRDALVVLLKAALVGTGLPAKTVTGSKPESLEGKTPLVSVMGSGTLRSIFTAQGNRVEFYFQVTVFVSEAEGAWTNAMAEDALDSIESIIAEVYESNRTTDNWDTIEYSDRSVIIEDDIAGKPYFIEGIPTVITFAGS